LSAGLLNASVFDATSFKKEGYTYVPVSPPKEAAPGFVFAAVTPADFAELDKHGYGMARSFETAVHHEQTDQNTAIVQAFSDYERKLYGAAKTVCFEKTPFVLDTQKLLSTIVHSLSANTTFGLAATC
jgi:hypothetical protein